MTRPFGLAEHPLRRPAGRQRASDIAFTVLVSAVAVFGAWRALSYIEHGVGLGAFAHAFALGAITFTRVVIILIFATIVWVEPDALLMDEPFSALDVLTSENLRGELLRLWRDGQFPTPTRPRPPGPNTIQVRDDH